MSTRVAKAMLSRMNLTYEAIGVVVTNKNQGLITIDDSAQLNEKSLEGRCGVPRRPGETKWGGSNPGVAVSAMSDANLKRMIYYIKIFKRIGHTCTHADLELSKVHAMYHQQDMGEAHKDPEVLTTVNPRDWPNTLETVEEYIR